MKPFIAEERDDVTLQNLGRASVQIIHDIRNQLNGLKLYATFLRKRMEKSELPAEEQDTVAKLIAGLDRAGGDLSLLAQYGQPLALNFQPQVDVQKLMRGVFSNLSNGGNGELDCSPVLSADSEPLLGEFDPAALADALQSISFGAAKSCKAGDSLSINLSREQLGDRPTAVIEWESVHFEHGNPFRSFNGSEAIRMSLAAKIVEAQGGSAEQHGSVLRVRLPLT